MSDAMRKPHTMTQKQASIARSRYSRSQRSISQGYR